MKKFNISVPKRYTKNGEEKTQWNNVGTLVKFDAQNGKPEGYVLELSMFPDTKFGVFEQTERGSQTVKEIKADITDTLTSKGVDDEVINAEEIPF